MGGWVGGDMEECGWVRGDLEECGWPRGGGMLVGCVKNTCGWHGGGEHNVGFFWCAVVFPIRKYIKDIGRGF